MSVAIDALKRQRDKLKLRGEINQAMAYQNAIQVVQRAEKEDAQLQARAANPTEVNHDEPQRSADT